MKRTDKRSGDLERSHKLGWLLAGRPRLVALALGLTLALLVLVAVLTPAKDLLGLGSGGAPSAQRAVIVDQLSLTAPNPDFIRTATATLKKGGYEVDYYPGEVVTVGFYRSLPERGYDLIVLRTHSTAVISRGEESVPTVSLFTNEVYNKEEYYDEQVAGRLGFASYFEGGPQVFGITAEFVRQSIHGSFDNALIVMMGCDGLKNDEAARAFLERGASAYVSWSEFVSAPHTDAATERLLELLTSDVPLKDAVAQTNAEIGPDPAFGSQLLYRPTE